MGQSVTKKDLVDSVSQQTKLSRAEVQKVLEVFLEELKHQFREGNRIEIRKLGHFFPVHLKSRVFRKPSGEKVMTTGYTTLRFKASSNLNIED